MKHVPYLPYEGTAPFGYVGCHASDEKLAAEITTRLIRRGFRLTFNSVGGKGEMEPERAATALHTCDGAVLFLSAKSLESLSFRNEINYLLSIHKPILYVKIGEFALTYGMEMQLANIPFLQAATNKETAEQLAQCGVLTQSMVGGGMVTRTYRRVRTAIMAGMVLLTVAVFGVFAAYTVKERTSAAYCLKNTDGAAYVDITPFGDEGIYALQGKKVEEIYMAGGTFSDLAALQEVSFHTVDVSNLQGNPALWPLTLCKDLETVKISQNQVMYARELWENGLRVVVTHEGGNVQ